MSSMYGCTYYDGNNGRPFDASKSYPFANSTITLDIESDTNVAADGTQQGYLHNIVTQEMAAGAPLSSYAAQTIATRTYTFRFHATIANNSARFHVYIPYRYEAVATEGTPAGNRQKKINYAVTQTAGIYMSVPGSDEPIFAAYGQDNCVYTKDGTAASPHLKSVYDPISEAENQAIPPNPTCRNDDPGRRTLDGGMGSNGAARWGRGNTNPYGNGSEWSVRWGEAAEVISGESWQEAYRILTHYYSGIELRNIYGQVLTPDYRWNPLILNWGNGAVAPPPMRYGGNGVYQVAITLQNTGTAPWTHISQGGAAKWYLSYRWRKGNRLQEGNRVEVAQSGQAQTVAEGEHRVVTLTVYDPPDWGAGEYLLQLDMLYETQAGGNIIWFNDEQESRWFTYNLKITPTFCPPDSCGSEVYLPFISASIPTPEPTPTDCVWEGNHLKNSIFSLGDNPLKYWDVWIDTSKKGCFSNTKLCDTNNYYSPDSGAAGTFLGGENDCNQPNGGDNNDQYIIQSVIVKDVEEVEAIRIGFSYCQVTYEQSNLKKDKFMVDLQAGTLGSGSAFSNTLIYTNLDALSAADSNNCRHDSGQWKRRERTVTGINRKYSGDRMFTLVFYSDVSEREPSTFYFDTAEINVCRRKRK